MSAEVWARVGISVLSDSLFHLSQRYLNEIIGTKLLSIRKADI